MRSQRSKARFLSRCIFSTRLNPLVGIVDTFRRAIILQQSPDYFALGISAAVALLLLPVAYLYFKYVELTVADTV